MTVQRLLWTALLGVVGLAWYFASLQENAGRSFPWELVVFAVLVGAGAAWVRFAPIPPVVREAVARAAARGRRCAKCGAARQPNDIFCSTCHPRLRIAIFVVAALGLAGAAWLLFNVH